MPPDMPVHGQWGGVAARASPAAAAQRQSRGAVRTAAQPACGAAAAARPPRPHSGKGDVMD